MKKNKAKGFFTALLNIATIAVPIVSAIIFAKIVCIMLGVGGLEAMSIIALLPELMILAAVSVVLSIIGLIVACKRKSKFFKAYNIFVIILSIAMVLTVFILSL